MKSSYLRMKERADAAIAAFSKLALMHESLQRQFEEERKQWRDRDAENFGARVEAEGKAKNLAVRLGVAVDSLQSSNEECNRLMAECEHFMECNGKQAEEISALKERLDFQTLLASARKRRLDEWKNDAEADAAMRLQRERFGQRVVDQQSATTARADTDALIEEVVRARRHFARLST